jgi:hypothetical protein
MTDNAGYRPTDDSALRWEDNYCIKCGCHDRYHFLSSDGKVYCRFNGTCVCAKCPAAAESSAPSIAGDGA